MIRVALLSAWMVLSVTAQASEWRVDTTRSRIVATAIVDGEPSAVQFTDFAVDLAFDPARPQEARIDVRVNVASLRARSRAEEINLREAPFFDVRRFPQARFSANGATELGGGLYRAAGELTLRGATRPLTIEFRPSFAGDRASATASTVLDRTIFGIGMALPEFARDTPLSHRVEIRIEIEAKRLTPP